MTNLKSSFYFMTYPDTRYWRRREVTKLRIIRRRGRKIRERLERGLSISVSAAGTFGGKTATTWMYARKLHVARRKYEEAVTWIIAANERSR